MQHFIILLLIFKKILFLIQIMWKEKKKGHLFWRNKKSIHYYYVTYKNLKSTIYITILNYRYSLCLYHILKTWDFRDFKSITETKSPLLSLILSYCGKSAKRFESLVITVVFFIRVVIICAFCITTHANYKQGHLVPRLCFSWILRPLCVFL